MEEKQNKLPNGSDKPVNFYHVAIGVLLAVCLSLLVALLYANNVTNETEQTLALYKVALKAEQEKIKELETKSTANAKSVTTKYYNFKSGNFVVGEDFEPGTYDVIAIKGYGNVISDDGEIVATMSTKQEDSLGIAEQEYKNITFKDGVTLEINGVEIRLKRVK